jgi:hypothetical protein
MSLSAWKFIIPPNIFVVVPPPEGVKVDGEMSYSGCMAIAVAETLDGAKAALRKYGAENGVDVSWIEVCDNGGPERGKVRRVEIADGAVLGISMV